MAFMSNFVRRFLKKFDVGIVRYSKITRLEEKLKTIDDFELLLALPIEHASAFVKYLPRSTSQLRQDLFVLSQVNFKRNGFFVEFGATDGVSLSNSYLLEKEFGWDGILAEPARCWHQALQTNRHVHIEKNCVWKYSASTLTFNEVKDAEFSTIDIYSKADVHRDTRRTRSIYDVETISLNDLLAKHNAPAEIDYLSIDTEGSEFDILENFDFSLYSFRVITCEHNFTPMRLKLHELLTKNGYIRKFESISKFDDWYVRAG